MVHLGPQTDALIIGAGPAGLTAGYLLGKAGKTVRVIERDPRYVGGISRTVRVDGFHFDVGGHRFLSKSKEVFDLWNEILPDDFLVRPRSSRIYFGGRYYAYPLQAGQVLRGLGVVRSTLCLASFVRAKLTPVVPPRSFHDWVRNQFGEKLYAYFFKTYTEKVWGVSGDAISADWAAQRIKGLSLKTAVADALKRSFRLKPGARRNAKTLQEQFWYPRTGSGMMWEAAAQKMAAYGGDCLMGRSLASLAWDSGAGVWTVTAATSAGTSEVYRAKHVVSSAPIIELADALAVSPACREHARQLKYRDFVAVALVVPRSALTGLSDNWLYIHDPGIKAGRIQNFSAWSPDMAPPGLACLELEYFCHEGDRLWSLPDSDAVALATAEIAKIGLVDGKSVRGGWVVRQSKAYPVYDAGYAAHVAAIRRELSQYPTLHLVGRNGLHRYNNQDHAMMTAMLTVQNILEGSNRFDVWAVNEDAEYAEAGLAATTVAVH